MIRKVVCFIKGTFSCILFVVEWVNLSGVRVLLSMCAMVKYVIELNLELKFFFLSNAVCEGNSSYCLCIECIYKVCYCYSQC